MQHAFFIGRVPPQRSSAFLCVFFFAAFNFFFIKFPETHFCISLHSSFCQINKAFQAFFFFVRSSCCARSASFRSKEGESSISLICAREKSSSRKKRIWERRSKSFSPYNGIRYPSPSPDAADRSDRNSEGYVR